MFSEKETVVWGEWLIILDEKETGFGAIMSIGPWMTTE